MGGAEQTSALVLTFAAGRSGSCSSTLARSSRTSTSCSVSRLPHFRAMRIMTRLPRLIGGKALIKHKNILPQSENKDGLRNYDRETRLEKPRVLIVDLLVS